MHGTELTWKEKLLLALIATPIGVGMAYCIILIHHGR